MNHREAAAIAYKEMGLPPEAFEIAAALTDMHTAGTNWPSDSYNQIPAGQERRLIDAIKATMRGEPSPLPSAEAIVGELDRIKSSN